MSQFTTKLIDNKNLSVSKEVSVLPKTEYTFDISVYTMVMDLTSAEALRALLMQGNANLIIKAIGDVLYIEGSK